MRRPPVLLSATAVIGVLCSSLAFAGDRDSWIGETDKGVRVYFVRTAGDNWVSGTSTRDGRDNKDDVEWTETRRNDDYIEIRCNVRPDSFFRLYKRQADAKRDSTNGRWVKVATGEWHVER